MKFQKVLFLFVFVSQIIFAQSGSFTPKLNNISTALQKVENSKAVFEQSITSENAGVASYVLLETSKKGKEKEVVFEFNFADIDINTVRYETVKDIIKVQLIVKQNQRMVKQLVDKEKVSYQKELYFIAKDVDNARDLVEKIKAIIPVSNQVTENRLSLSGYNDRLNWLIKNIQNVEGTTNKNEQTFLKDTNYPASVVYTSEESKGTKSIKKTYNFNLSMINANTIYFKNKGTDFIISLETKRKLKTIRLSEEGVIKNYINKFDIVCKNVENARELQKVLQDIVPLADEKFKSSMPKISTVSEGNLLISEKVNVITSEKNTTKQNLKGDCLTVLTKVIETSKEYTSQKHEFNFADINKQDIDIVVKGKMMYVVAKTIANNKFIKFIKNETQQNYVSAIQIACNSAEEAIICKQVLKDITVLCAKNKTSYANSVTALQEALKKIVMDKLSYEQKIESLSDGNIKFTSTKISDKKSDESIQEFKLTDINPKAILMKVSGKKVKVEFSTNFEEKIIKTYKNGEIKSYTNKGVVYCNSIENARNISQILKNLSGKK